MLFCYTTMMPEHIGITRLRRLFFPRIIVRRRVRRAPQRKKSTALDIRRYNEHKEAAGVLVHAKLEKLNAHYGFTYGRVTIRDQRSRWGSCSKKGNLNFNYRLLFLPEELSDAVVVHELCHLKEFNHSSKFWALVGETIPDYIERKKKLAKLSLKEAKQAI